MPAPATVITPSFQVPLPRVRGAVDAIVAAATVEAMAPLLIVRAVEVAPPSVWPVVLKSSELSVSEVAVMLPLKPIALIGWAAVVLAAVSVVCSVVSSTRRPRVVS